MSFVSSSVIYSLTILWTILSVVLHHVSEDLNHNTFVNALSIKSRGAFTNDSSSANLRRAAHPQQQQDYLEQILNDANDIDKIIDDAMEIKDERDDDSSRYIQIPEKQLQEWKETHEKSKELNLKPLQPLQPLYSLLENTDEKPPVAGWAAVRNAWMEKAKGSFNTASTSGPSGSGKSSTIVNNVNKDNDDQAKITGFALPKSCLVPIGTSGLGTSSSGGLLRPNPGGETHSKQSKQFEMQADFKTMQPDQDTGTNYKRSCNFHWKNIPGALRRAIGSSGKGNSNGKPDANSKPVQQNLGLFGTTCSQLLGDIDDDEILGPDFKDNLGKLRGAEEEISCYIMNGDRGSQEEEVLAAHVVVPLEAIRQNYLQNSKHGVNTEFLEVVLPAQSSIIQPGTKADNIPVPNVGKFAKFSNIAFAKMYGYDDQGKSCSVGNGQKTNEKVDGALAGSADNTPTEKWIRQTNTMPNGGKDSTAANLESVEYNPYARWEQKQQQQQRQALGGLGVTKRKTWNAVQSALQTGVTSNGTDGSKSQVHI